MPTYVYECSECKATVEISRLVKDRDYPVRCIANGSHCDPTQQKMKRIIAQTSFILKGKGWAKDGYSK